MKYTVILPTYNEAGSIGILISDILSLGKEYYVLVVDDNSQDGTASIVSNLSKNEPRVSLLRRKRKLGLGSAYKDGIQKALETDSDYIFEMDADLSHDFRDLPRFVSYMEHFDLTIGSRYLEGMRVTDWSLPRLLLSYSGNVFASLITGLKTSDNTSGFKCFKRHVLESVDLNSMRSNGYAFQVEMNYLASQKNFRIGEMPIVFKKRVFGNSKLSCGIVMEAILVICGIRLRAALKKEK